MTEEDREHLCTNTVGSLAYCKPETIEGMLNVFYKVDQDYGDRIKAGIAKFKKELDLSAQT